MGKIKDLDAARKVFEHLTKEGYGNNATVWLAWCELERVHSPPDVARAVLLLMNMR